MPGPLRPPLPPSGSPGRLRGPGAAPGRAEALGPGLRGQPRRARAGGGGGPGHGKGARGRCPPCGFRAPLRPVAAAGPPRWALRRGLGGTEGIRGAAARWGPRVSLGGSTGLGGSRLAGLAPGEAGGAPQRRDEPAGCPGVFHPRPWVQGWQRPCAPGWGKRLGVTSCGAVGAQRAVRETRPGVGIGQKTPKFRLLSEKRRSRWILLLKGIGADREIPCFADKACHEKSSAVAELGIREGMRSATWPPCLEPVPRQGTRRGVSASPALRSSLEQTRSGRG